MKISEIKELPKLYRVIKIDLDTLRMAVGSGYGAYETDEVVSRNARRVLCSTGWKWQIVTEDKNQSDWDYYLEQDKEILNDINYELGLI